MDVFQKHIQSSSLDDAYSKLPVILIKDWKDLLNNQKLPEMLQAWADKLAPFYEEGSALRQQVLHVSHFDIFVPHILIFILFPAINHIILG